MFVGKESKKFPIDVDLGVHKSSTALLEFSFVNVYHIGMGKYKMKDTQDTY